MTLPETFDVAVIGCGSAGLATAYYLARKHGMSNIVLIDAGQPMAFTSAQSGENYRNWWPHPAMVDFTDRSIDLLDEIAAATDNRIAMTRRGYALVTRTRAIDELISRLHDGLGERADALIRYHDDPAGTHYERPVRSGWENVPDGVDVLRHRALIRSAFPSYAHDVETVVHIRRGGDISAQQLGMHMLETLREAGARRLVGSVEAIEGSDPFTLEIDAADGTSAVTTARVVNAAGPFAGRIAGLLGVALPLQNTFQQKIAFEDRDRAIPRDLPFSIDLDGQHIDWLEDERRLLLDEPAYRRFAERMPGGIHCRPDGGDGGHWVKLGWAYNDEAAAPARELPLDAHFPDIVLRGAARLNPALRRYYGALPRAMHHYGGWYTSTEENWPLIGPMGPEGAFMVCALSGFGTMAACAAGELCAAWVADAARPAYAREFSLQRYADEALVSRLRGGDKGIL